MSEKEPKISSEAEWKEFSSLLGSLPLENCTRECNPVTKEWGWKAPEGKAFRISGQFVVYYDADSSDMTTCRPLGSADFLKEEYGKKYADFLEETEGDEDEALSLLSNYVNEWDYGMPDKFFEGKWLMISPDFKQELQLDEQNNLEVPELMIKRDIEARADREYFGLIKDISPQSQTITEVFFESKEIQEHWSQDYASAVLGKCKIELVDCLEKEADFFVPAPIDSKQIYIPDSVSVKPRLNEDQKKAFEKAGEDYKDLIFVHLSSDSDLIVAQRRNEVFTPQKKIDRLHKKQQDKKF